MGLILNIGMTFFNTILDFFGWAFGSKKDSNTDESISPVGPVVPNTQTLPVQPILESITLNIPQRSSNALSGSEFVKTIMNLTGNKRESLILNEFLSGNVPEWNRILIPIEISDGTNKLTYYTTPNYLTIGSNDDWFICPLFPTTAQKIANAFCGSLVTKKMVDQIYKSADIKLNANPFGPPYDSTMESTQRFVWSNDKIKSQLVGKDLSKLCAGHKKDIIIDNALAGKKNVCIYGWFKDGKVIQGPNAVSHSNGYSDYSHSCRLVSQEVMLNENKTTIYEIFKNPILSKMLNESGILTYTKYII